MSDTYGRQRQVQVNAYDPPARRPINRSKNFAESRSTATLAFGTNPSRNTGEVVVPPSAGADPRIGRCAAACFSASGPRRKSPPKRLARDAQSECRGDEWPAHRAPCDV